MMVFYLKYNNPFHKNSITSRFTLKTISSIIICLLHISPSFANGYFEKDTITKQNTSSNKAGDIEKLLKVDEKNSILLFKENKINRDRNLLFDAIYKNIQDADIILKTGIDYKGFTSELDYVIKLKKTAIDGIIKNKNDFQTLRNITVTSVMLKELQTRIDIQLVKIKKNRFELSKIQSKIDSLTIKDVLFTLPKDPSTKSLYYDRYNGMNSEVNLLNKRFKDALDSINKLQFIGSKFKYDLQNDIIETDSIRKNEFTRLFSPDGEIFNSSSNKMTFYESFFYSLTKELIVLAFFISNHIETIFLMFLFIIALIVYLLTLKSKYKKEELYDKITLSKQIFKHPIACAILVSFTLFNFLFVFPPFAFTALIWLVSMIALTIVNKEYFNKKEKRVWKIYMVFVFLGLFDNNILIHSVNEVFLILVIALAVGLFNFYNLKKNSDNINQLLRFTLYVVILFEIASILFIVIQKNYNLGKVLMINGIIIILMYYLFVNTYRLIFDIVNYSNFLGESNEERQLDINDLENVNLTPKINILFIMGGLVSIGKNSYFFHIIIDPVFDFFAKQRTIGDINYSFENIFLFFFIIITSVFVAKIVSFLTSNKFGNWLLLIQITIFSIGLSLAFITCGIPVDRLTIIISALGVGIGFGLQTLVNNLVSGLIIAFEKPVNLDDIIEIQGQMVRMKSIGIRSSVVSTFDGADVIIPNGDLLSQHLTNWTLSSNKKRTDIKIGVAYGTDLEKTKKLLQEVLNSNSLVLKYPEPIVWVTEFNSSSVDIVVKYWVGHVNFANDTKSQLMISIDAVFRANNIEIPFPQQDIHLKQVNTNESDNE